MFHGGIRGPIDMISLTIFATLPARAFVGKRPGVLFGKGRLEAPLDHKSRVAMPATSERVGPAPAWASVYREI